MKQTLISIAQEFRKDMKELYNPEATAKEQAMFLPGVCAVALGYILTTSVIYLGSKDTKYSELESDITA